MRIVIKKQYIRNAYVFSVLICTFIFGTMVAYNSMHLDERINNKLFIIFIMSVLLLFTGNRSKKEAFDGMSKAFFLFCCLTFIAALFRGDTGIMLSVALGVITYVLLRRSYFGYDRQMYVTTGLAAIFSCMVIILRYSVESFNSQGIIICFTGIMLMNLLCIKEHRSLWVYLICLIIVVTLLSISRSRTCMMAFLVVGIITYWHLYLRKWSLKSFLILLLSAMATIYFSNHLIAFFERIFFKKWSNIDLTSNRINLWRSVINDKSVAGHGINHISGDAHNAFIQALGVSGLLGLIGLVILVIYIIYRILKLREKTIYLNFFSGWIIVAMFENLEVFTSRMVPVTVLLMIHILMLSGAQYSNNKVIETTDE